MNDLLITKSTVDYSVLAGIWASTTLAEGELLVVDGDGALIVGGTLQIETATGAGSIEGAGVGNATVILTSGLVTGSPLTVTYAVANSDTPTLWVAKAKIAMNAVSAITTHFTIGGGATTITLTAKVIAANDSALNMALADGTCTGITPAASSADTEAGILTAVTADKIQLLLGTVEGTPKVTSMIYKTGLKYEKQAYVAPVAAVKCVGSDLPASAGSYSLNVPTMSVGLSVGIAIRDMSKPTEETGAVRYYSTTTITGDLWSTKVATNPLYRIVAAINADSNAIVTAVAHEDGSNAIDGIKLTCDTAGEDFNVFVLSGALQNADIVGYTIVNGAYDATATTTSVANVKGIGTPTQLIALEKDLSTRDGYSGRQFLPEFYTVASKVAAGQTYVIYTITSIYPDQGTLVNHNKFTNVIMVAIPAGETGDGEDIVILDSILAEFI